MDFINLHIRLFLILFVSSLALIIIWAIVGGIIESSVKDPATYKHLSYVSYSIFIPLFLTMAFSMPPLLIHYFLKMFIAAQISVGHADVPTIKYIINNREKIISTFTYSMWGLFLLGLVIAFPQIKNGIQKIKR